MLPISDQQLRGAFVNTSRKESSSIHVPEGLEALDWPSLDYLGWRDPKLVRRAYAIVQSLDGDPVGILLRQSATPPRTRAQCSWCQDVRLPNDVVFFGAKRAGSAGRNGNTIGTLLCERFECSRNVRNDPPPAYEGFDVEAARLRRIDDLRLRSASFAESVLRQS